MFIDPHFLIVLFIYITNYISMVIILYKFVVEKITEFYFFFVYANVVTNKIFSNSVIRLQQYHIHKECTLLHNTQ